LLRKHCFCGGSLVDVKIHDQFLNNYLQLCESCKMLLIQKEPTALELQEFYETNYSKARQAILSKAYFEVMRKRAEAQLNFILIKGKSLTNERIFDFGCGYGLLLDEFKRCGAITFGFDHDPEGMRNLDKKGHIKVAGDMFSDDHIFSWDLVCLSHVLEHLPSPVQFLRDRV